MPPTGRVAQGVDDALDVVGESAWNLFLVVACQGTEETRQTGCLQPRGARPADGGAKHYTISLQSVVLTDSLAPGIWKGHGLMMLQVVEHHH